MHEPELDLAIDRMGDIAIKIGKIINGQNSIECLGALLISMKFIMNIMEMRNGKDESTIYMNTRISEMLSSVSTGMAEEVKRGKYVHPKNEHEH